MEHLLLRKQLHAEWIIIRYIGWSKKMAQPLISHKFQSGLHSHVQLHTRQLQPLYEFSIESDQKYGNARCFKKGCVKIQYCALITAK